MPALPTSVRTAGFILLALMIYFVGSMMFRGPAENRDASEGANASVERETPDVLVRPAIQSLRTVHAVLKGSTEPDREVTVRSETMGTVSNARAVEGQKVKSGTVLCGLDIESRAARIAEAEASVEAARLDFDAAKQLEEKGWTTSNNAAAAKAALDRAEAGLAAARIELGKTNIRAPFEGIFEARLAERGDFLSVGAPCGRVVDLDPIIVAVEATEDQFDFITVGDPVEVTLSTGRQVEGQVRFVARAASAQTRTFRVEVEIPNPDYVIAAGVTASATLRLGEARALQITPASLVLHDDGRVGVRYVDDKNVVQFAEVSIIDDAPDGIWIAGIPEDVNLLSAGQDFLKEGVKVNPRPAEES